MDIERGIYRYFRRNEYEVLGMATHCETMEKMVTFKALFYEEECGYGRRQYGMKSWNMRDDL